MDKFIAVIISLIFLSACKKEEANVFIRIQNSSVTQFTNLAIGDVEYGELSPLKTSRYQLMTQPIYSAFCTVSTGDGNFFIGVGICGTPPLPPAFANGKYTFIIKNSVSNPGYYDLEVKQE